MRLATAVWFRPLLCAVLAAVLAATPLADALARPPAVAAKAGAVRKPAAKQPIGKKAASRPKAAAAKPAAKFAVKPAAKAKATRGQPAAVRPRQTPLPPKPAPAPAVPVQASGVDAERAQALAASLSRVPGKVAVAGLIVDADSGAVVMDLQAQRPMYPASVAKLFSTAAAARTFAPEHVLKTEVRVGPVESGRAAWLAVVGSGDPSMDAGDWAKLAEQVAATGIRQVSKLVIDATVFDDHLPAGFDEKQTDAAYRAPIGGIQSSSGALSVQVRPGPVGAPPSVILLPDPGEAAVVVNQAQTIAGGKDTLAISTRPLGRRTEIVVTGTIAASRKVVGSGARRVADGSYFAAGVFRMALERRGVTVRGETHFGPAEAGKALASHTSPPMRQLLAHTNKHSHNGYAETLFKLVGAKVGGVPATNAKSQESVRKALEGLQIRWERVKLGNGSGLYHADQVTCETVVDLLRAMAADPAGEVWRSSLPIGGKDGTLRGRQHAFAGQVRAKTGTLDDVSGLAGYAEADGRRYVFAFFFNNLRGGPGPYRAAQDRTLQRLLQP